MMNHGNRFLKEYFQNLKGFHPIPCLTLLFPSMVAISSFSRWFQLSLTVIHDVKYLNWDFRNAEKIGLGRAEKRGGTRGRKPFSRGCRPLIQPLPLCFGVNQALLGNPICQHGWSRESRR